MNPSIRSTSSLLSWHLNVNVGGRDIVNSIFTYYYRLFDEFIAIDWSEIYDKYAHKISVINNGRMYMFANAFSDEKRIERVIRITWNLNPNDAETEAF